MWKKTKIHVVVEERTEDDHYETSRIITEVILKPECTEPLIKELHRLIREGL